jgi:hypothetical protein
MLCIAWVTGAYAADRNPIVCKQQYALCTSAPCTPDPKHAGYATCECVVLQGDSVGYKTCAERAPIQVSNQSKKIISTFSFAQYASKKFLTCAAGLPWTNCLDSLCSVDPHQPNHAKCDCPIETKSAFITLGGDCKTTACNGLWSAATVAMGKQMQATLTSAIKNSHSLSRLSLNTVHNSESSS